MKVHMKERPDQTWADTVVRRRVSVYLKEADRQKLAEIILETMDLVRGSDGSYFVDADNINSFLVDTIDRRHKELFRGKTQPDQGGHDRDQQGGSPPDVRPAEG